MRLGPDQALCEGLRRCAGAIRAQRFLATATKSLRNKRIFVDYLRNGRGATAVASYSLRARPGAPVALPIAWGDLAKLKRADAFTIKDVPAKLNGGAKTLGPASGSETESGAMGAGRPVARAYASDPWALPGRT
jgi:DNA primase